MKARSFSHVGITVSDFNAAVRFYWEMFGAPLVGVSETPSDRVRTFFGVDAPQPTCRIGWIRVPGGATIEIFEFQPQQPAQPVTWSRVGLTHFSINVRNIHRWHAALTAKGVTVLGPPQQSPNGGQWFFFIRDMDGNLIEIMDLGRMYYVLQWLGALGGWLFRRDLVFKYRRYYEPR